jgi:hypothetical protein
MFPSDAWGGLAMPGPGNLAHFTPPREGHRTAPQNCTHRANNALRNDTTQWRPWSHTKEFVTVHSLLMSSPKCSPEVTRIGCMQASSSYPKHRLNNDHSQITNPFKCYWYILLLSLRNHCFYHPVFITFHFYQLLNCHSTDTVTLTCLNNVHLYYSNYSIYHLHPLHPKTLNSTE